jgi:hypothetical protein
MLALDGPARAWEPKRLRLGLFTTAGHWPPPAAAPFRHLALVRPAHRGDHPPARLRPRLTTPSRPYDQKGQTSGPVESRPPDATAGKPATARAPYGIGP